MFNSQVANNYTQRQRHSKSFFCLLTVLRLNSLGDILSLSEFVYFLDLVIFFGGKISQAFMNEHFAVNRKFSQLGTQ